MNSIYDRFNMKKGGLRGLHHIEAVSFLSGRSMHCKESFHLGKYLVHKWLHFPTITAQPRSGRKD